MKLIGFNLNKINAEKTKNTVQGQLEVNTNINITDLKEVKAEFFSDKEKILAFDFKYTINYKQDFAKLIFEGTLILAFDSKLAKDILKQWKDKNIPEELRIDVFNLILRKTNVKALSIEEDINLPLHINMPRLEKKSNSNN